MSALRTALPHPLFTYTRLVEKARVTMANAEMHTQPDGDMHSVRLASDIERASKDAQLALIEFVHLNYEELMEAFK